MKNSQLLWSTMIIMLLIGFSFRIIETTILFEDFETSFRYEKTYRNFFLSRNGLMLTNMCIFWLLNENNYGHSHRKFEK